MTENFLLNIDKSWTLFLDRDGVINKRIVGGYVSCVDEFEFLPGVLESIKYFSEKLRRIIVITNQQGVGKAIMTESELTIVHNHMKNKVVENGGKIDAIYYCTDLATSLNTCRKPSIKMAQKCVNDFPDIDLNKSIMIGDSLSDIEFGKNAGMKTVFVNSHDEDSKAIRLADLKAASFVDFKHKLEKLTK